MPNLDHDTIELAFIVVTGLSVLVQTIILLAIFLSVRKATKAMKDDFDEMRDSVMPVVADTQKLIKRITPKLESVVASMADVAVDLKDVSAGLKQQSKEVEAALSEVIERVRQQTSRIDSMISGALDGVDRVGEFVASAVNRPVRQVSALLAGAKAIVEALREPSPSPRETYAPEETEPFV